MMSSFEDRLVNLTRDLVLIESTDAKPDQRHRCFQWVRNHLEGVSGLELTMHASNGYESLVAMPEGISRPEILLCGHLDVVEHPNADVYTTEVKDGRIYGPGTGDMKGAVVILLELMRHVHHNCPGVSLGLAITSDEEVGGPNGLGFLVEQRALRCGVAIIPDGGSLTDITVEEKGVLHLRLHAEGVAAHGARPWLGTNALERLMERLAILKQEFEVLRKGTKMVVEDGPHWYPTCSVTGISTPNESPNRIPERASAIVDVRFPPGRTLDEMLKHISDVLGPDIHVEPMMTADPTHLSPDPLFVDATAEITGETPKLVKASGGSDSRFLCAHGIPVMLSRPKVGNLHGSNEWIEVASMRAYFKI